MKPPCKFLLQLLGLLVVTATIAAAIVSPPSAKHADGPPPPELDRLRAQCARQAKTIEQLRSELNIVSYELYIEQQQR